MTECEYLDDQTKCRFYRYNKFTSYCIYYRKEMDNHCDNYTVQNIQSTRKENLNNWKDIKYDGR